MPLQTRFFRVTGALLTSLIVLAASAAVHAQTETPTPLQDVAIAVTVTDRPTRLAAELIGLPVQNRLQDDFAAVGYRVMRAQPDQAQMWVKLMPRDDKTLSVVITLTESFLPALPSDILISTVAPATFSVPQDEAAATVSEVTLALNGAVQTCVSPSIHGALSPADANLVAGTINFYAANCHAAAGKLTAASAGYRNALGFLIGPGIPFNAQIAPTVNLAWAAYHEGRASVAFDLLDRLLGAAKEPADRAAILSRRSALLALDFQFADAIADLKAAIALAPNDPALYVDLGQRILLTYEWDQVLDAYNRAIAIDPTYAPAYFQRGVLFYTEGPRANALKDFQTYLELAPNGKYANEAASYIGGIQQTTAGEIQQGK